MAAPFLPDPAELWQGMDVPDPDDQATLMDAADLAADYPDADDYVVAALLDDESPWWRIDGDQHAEWAMALAGATIQAMADIEAQEAEYIGRVRDWTARMTAPLRARGAWVESQLTAWALRRRAETKGAVKTFRVPSGEVRTRAPREPSPMVVDVDAVVAWAKLHHPDIVQVKEWVNNGDLGKVARVGTIRVPHPDTGEVREVETVVFDAPDGTQVAVPGTGIHTATTSVTVVPYEVK